MSPQESFALRLSRKGTGVLPPNATRWEQEHNGLDLRHEMNLALEDRLDHIEAFELVPEVLGVLAHTDLDLSDEQLQHFSGTRSNRWSGYCVRLPEGDYLVVYNANHPETRIRATLMEELFHLRLGHKPTTVRTFQVGERVRDFDSAKEGEAYGSGAAALVPYKPLRAMLTSGMSVHDIAVHFEVSDQLVQFRINVSRLGRLGQPSRRAPRSGRG